MEVYISGSIPDYVSEIDANLKTLWQENPYRDNWSNEEAMRFYQIAMELVFAKDKMLRIIYDFTSKFNKWGDLLQKIHGKSRLELIQLYPLLNPIKPFYIDNYKLRAIIMAFESSYQDPHGSVGVFIDNFMVRFGSNWHIAQDQQKRVVECDRSFYAKQLLQFTSLENKPICFAFDEARVLLDVGGSQTNGDNALWACRKALSFFEPDHLRRTPILTAVFIDTSSKIATVCPQSSPLRDPIDIHPPLWCIPGRRSSQMEFDQIDMEPTFEFISSFAQSFNSNKEDEMNIALADRIDEIQLCFDFALRLFRVGRPLWYTYLNSIQSSGVESKWNSLDTVLNLAKAKLAREFDHSKQIEGQDLLAVLDSRLCLSVTGDTTLASSMVAENMSVCYYMSDKRNFLVAGYPVEPVIGTAAVHWMNIVEYEKQFGLLIEHIANGIVGRGYRGELLSRVLLTIGFDRAMAKMKQAAQPIFGRLHTLLFVTVKQFLLAMYGNEILYQLEASTKSASNNIQTTRQENLQILLDGQVNIKQWIKTDQDPPFSSAEHYFKIGVTIMTEYNTKAKGKLIPVRLAANRYTWIIVEDRNNADRYKYKKTVAETHSVPVTFPGNLDSPEPYLILYCQFGDLKPSIPIETLFKGPSHRTPKSSKHFSDKCRRFVVGIFGISDVTCAFLAEQKAGYKKDRLVSMLELLRDGSVTASKPQHQLLGEFWEDSADHLQESHDIILS